MFKRSISTVGLMFTAVGGIVGSGWLFGPFYAAKIAGPAAVLSWLLGGCLMMVIALTFAELATMFPLAGGMVRFAHLSHGKFASFTMAWVSWLAALIVAPIETMAALQYAANYLPWLAHSTAHGVELTVAGIGVAAVFMFLMCCLNMIGVKLFSKTNNLIVLWKLVIPFVTIIILFCHFHASHLTKLRGGFMPYGWKGVVAALPAAGVIFSFIGYSPAIQLAGEAKNPQRAIPIAIIGSLSLCIVLYVALQFAFVGAVSPHAVAHGWNHLSFKGDAGPVAGVLTLLGLVWFVKVLYVDAVISPFGTAYIYTASTARVAYAMSENGYMPEELQKLNKGGVPYLAILLNFVVGMLFFLPFPGWQAMVGFLVSCFVIAYAVGPIACMALRKTMPEQPRPFKLPFAYGISLLAFYICNLIIYWTSWTTVWRMLMTIVLGYVVLFGYRKITKDKSTLDMKKAYWILPYFVGLALISYLGNFAGIKLIPFGWDFVVLAVFSWVIFHFAVRAASHSKPQ